MQLNKIIIGVDDSKISTHAVEYGFSLARQYNAQVGLVHIIEPIVTQPAVDPEIMGGLVPGMGVTDPFLVESQQQQSESLLTSVEQRYGQGLTVTHFTEIGNTADALVECAAQYKADLIVVGTHNRTGLSRLVMGSVAEHVVRHSHIPVLVVPIEAAISA